MKYGNKLLKEYILQQVRKILLEAEEEKPKEEPEEKADDAAATDQAATQEPAAQDPNAAATPPAGGGGEEEAGKEGAPPQEPQGVPIKFKIGKVKKYNDNKFTSDSGIVKKIDKKGIVVTTQPDGVDILVNFDDITESAKGFFKAKKKK
jgi:hypothetical protein